MSGFRCQFCKGSLTKVHYPKLYNMAHLLSLNVFTASKGSNNYIFFPANSTDLQGYIVKVIANKHEMITVTVKRQERRLDGNYSKTRSSHDDLTFSCYTCDIYIIIEKI